MTKAIKYIILGAIITISLYNSVYIESLDDVKKDKNKTIFNAKEYAGQFMGTKIETLPAINVSEFLNGLIKDVKSYCERNGHKLGISNDFYFIVEGNTTVSSIEEENVVIVLDENKDQKMNIATDFIFGNAIREGSQMANIGDYQNTMDYNNISVELNNIVRDSIIPQFIQIVNVGDKIYFKGAVEVNVKNPKLNGLRIIPLVLKIKN